ncbi:hypothetical protein AB6A40_006428 [Gnathostoma spinigerum]|uniref:C2H2-type domain-containing protein n=1 Tax=Gnathostoma spinigerum TaxID=75299 RepID=A0ABD6ENJ5_9BILA
MVISSLDARSSCGTFDQPSLQTNNLTVTGDHPLFSPMDLSLDQNLLYYHLQRAFGKSLLQALSPELQSSSLCFSPQLPQINTDSNIWTSAALADVLQYTINARLPQMPHLSSAQLAPLLAYYQQSTLDPKDPPVIPTSASLAYYVNLNNSLLRPSPTPAMVNTTNIPLNDLYQLLYKQTASTTKAASDEDSPSRSSSFPIHSDTVINSSGSADHQSPITFSSSSITPLALPTKKIVSKNESQPSSSTDVMRSDVTDTSVDPSHQQSPVTLSSHSATVVYPTCKKIKVEENSSQAEAGTSQLEDETCDDERDETYVDVESMDDEICTKKQRKAHIEFYRKLKSLRLRGDELECHLCGEKILNTEHSIRTHVHRHSSTALFRCRMCGAHAQERTAIFAHIHSSHPNREPSSGFEDRRDMTHLASILVQCFPRTTLKTRATYMETIDRICRQSEDKSMSKIVCDLCSKIIPTQKASVSRHARTHPSYRCKQCKTTCSSKEEMTEHCSHSHEVFEPKQGCDYNVCNANEVMSAVLRKCFPAFFASSSPLRSGRVGLRKIRCRYSTASGDRTINCSNSYSFCARR